MAYKSNNSPLRQYNNNPDAAIDANGNSSIGSFVTQDANAIRANDIARTGGNTVMNSPGVGNNSFWANRGVQPAMMNQSPPVPDTAMPSGPATDIRGRNVQMQGMDLNQTGFVSSQKANQINALKGLYGSPMAGTMVRNNDTYANNFGSPLAQAQDQNMVQDTSVLPPNGVQTSITPTLGFENS